MSAPDSPAFPLFLGLLAALSWWLYKETSGEKVLSQVASENAADAFVEQMIIDTINEQGTLEYRLSADHADYFADSRAELRNPSLVIMREQGQPWHLNADRAQITDQGNLIELFDAVEIRRNPEPGQNAIHARTSHLLIRPDAQTAETGARVVLEIAESRITADGMRAFLKQGRVELLSGVTGRYEQQDKQ